VVTRLPLCLAAEIAIIAGETSGSAGQMDAP
jgi:hypothetical protein